MSDNETRPVLCGSCRVPVNVEVDSNPKTVTCPSCGRHDTVENAAREAAEHYASKALREAFKGIGTSGHGFKMTVTSSPQRQSRFIFG